LNYWQKIFIEDIEGETETETETELQIQQKQEQIKTLSERKMPMKNEGNRINDTKTFLIFNQK